MKKNEFRLENDEIHIWNIHLDHDATGIAKYEILLSKEEKNRASRFKFQKDKIVYISARGILRLLSGKYLNIYPKEILFDYTEYGKPFFKSESSLKFNVSHSGERIVIAFCQNHQIGVDIEKIKDDFDVLELARNFFSKNEIRALENIPKEESYRAFYRCWTRKEAFIKAEGSGLSFPLDKFAVSIEDDDHAELLKTVWDEEEKDNWSLFSFVPEVNYLGALAIKKKLAIVKSYYWYF